MKEENSDNDGNDKNGTVVICSRSCQEVFIDGASGEVLCAERRGIRCGVNGEGCFLLELREPNEQKDDKKRLLG